MTNLFTKIKTALFNVTAFALACVMAGLGLAVASVLALFAMALIGLGLLVAPFMAHRIEQEAAQDDDGDTAPAAA